MGRAVAAIYADNFWFWEACCLRIATSVADYEALLHAPLSTVAAWYIKQAANY